MRIPLFFWVLVCLVRYPLGEEQVRFQLKVEDSQVQPGSQIKAVLEANLTRGWHLYSMTQPPGGPVSTSISVVEDAVFLQKGQVEQPKPHEWFDPNFGINTEYFEDKVNFQIPVGVKVDAVAGKHELLVKVRFQLCSDRLCLAPQRKTFSATVEVSTLILQETQGTAPGGLLDSIVGEEKVGLNSTSRISSEEISGIIDQDENSLKEISKKREGVVSLLVYIWLAMGMGALALLTPCVFPMIPITVSYFTKQQSSRRRALAEAGLYALGIVLAFTLVGFTMTFLFGAKTLLYSIMFRRNT